MAGPQQPTPAGPVTCTWCGRTADGDLPMAWSMQTSERGVQTLCEACTRDNVRAIEAKLDSEWW